MSLKYIHIAFIVLCILAAWCFAVWSFLMLDLPGYFRALGGFSLLGGFALLIYGIKFYRKAKNIIT